MTHYHTPGRYSCSFVDKGNSTHYKKQRCSFVSVYAVEVKCHYRTVHHHRHFPCTRQGCTRAFTSSSRLAAHIWSVHLGVKLYRCQWPSGCKFACADRSAIVSHIRTVHFRSIRTQQGSPHRTRDTRDVQRYIKLDITTIDTSSTFLPISKNHSSFLKHSYNSIIILFIIKGHYYRLKHLLQQVPSAATTTE